MITMKEYTIYCTEDQTKRAVKLGAPIPPYKGGTLSIKTLLTNKVEWYSDIKEPLVKDDENLYIIPTTQQMIGWLDTKSLYITANMVGWCVTVLLENDVKNIHKEKCADSNSTMTRKDNELSAINAALDYLEKGE